MFLYLFTNNIVFMNFQDYSIEYDPKTDIVIRKVISKYIVLDDTNELKDSIAYISDLLIKNKCNKLFSDFSLTGIVMDYEAEYNFVINFKKIFTYPEGTFIALYEGKFYTKKKWDIFRKILKESNINYLTILVITTKLWLG